MLERHSEGELTRRHYCLRNDRSLADRATPGTDAPTCQVGVGHARPLRRLSRLPSGCAISYDAMFNTLSLCAARTESSVGMGLRPAKPHEKARLVGQAILPADSLSASPAACKAACFFDPVPEFSPRPRIPAFFRLRNPG
jgi:hypothetical protein